MAQPATIIDAPSSTTVRHGSQTIVFSGGASGTLVAEDIDYKKGTRALDQNDEMGKALKAAYVPTKGTGTIMVQLKSATTQIAVGETGAFLNTDGSTSISFYVIDIGTKYAQNEVVKVTLTIAEKLN